MWHGKFSILLALCASVVRARTIPVSRDATPTVKLDDGTFTGTSTGTVNKFLGIPFAQPPTGNLRFNLPQAIDSYNGTYTVTEFGPACPQQSISLPLPDGLAANVTDWLVNSIYGVVFPDDEDCLTINVVTPASATESSKLPVALWIFGGGFELGDPSLYDGGIIVDRSIALGEPVIYVSMNYRVSAWGFLASQEVKDAGIGNLGLQDQRLAFKWVQKYIEAFGGDPDKVTIWGESAGAISATLHMLTNDGDTEGLFRGAFMESGGPIPVGDISHGQQYYDFLVSETGCSSADDTLQCLREVPYDTLKDAVNQTPGIFSYQSLLLAWLPRVDGKFLTDLPEALVQQGKVADIPFVTGNNDDEGTLFAFGNDNITTSGELRDYITTYYLPDASSSEIDQIMNAYPDDPAQGSPFDTGDLNQLTPQYKRIAAMLGDLVFQAPRRFFVQQRAGEQKIWSYLSKRLKSFPIVGSAHATDILNVYGPGDMTDSLINFANNLDPNGESPSTEWPQYTEESPQLMTFLDGLIPRTISDDTYRDNVMEFLTTLSLKYPI